jgi:perosamine synthetase
MIKTIFTSLSPNVEKDDMLLSIKTLFMPWTWKRGDAQIKLQKALMDYFSSGKVFLFESGRTSLYAMLKACDLKKNDEVLIQAYTCVAVPDPILWAGSKPVYVDVDKNFNMSSSDLETKITKNSKVLIIQHTFGMPADIDALMAIAKKHNLIVIEDCAHALGSIYKGKRVGTFGDATFLSFGRDKVISSVFGGAVIVRDKGYGIRNKDFNKKLRKFPDECQYPSLLWIKQQLFHPIVTYVAKITYDIYFGKIIMRLVKKFRLLSRAVYPIEKRGGRPQFIEKKMPNALCVLALHQFQKLEHFNNHRKEIASIYDAEFKGTDVVLPQQPKNFDSIFLRYTILVHNQNEVFQKARDEKIFLGDWYTTPIAPKGVDYKKIYFEAGDGLKMASLYCVQTVNLPTSINISIPDAKRIVSTIKKVV